uniref:Putative secreted protein n=1 Tax=Anopheles darlingi TaxID=43151 RepID=A0A2M4DB08_ANODA
MLLLLLLLGWMIGSKVVRIYGSHNLCTNLCTILRKNWLRVLPRLQNDARWESAGNGIHFHYCGLWLRISSNRKRGLILLLATIPFRFFFCDRRCNRHAMPRISGRRNTDTIVNYLRTNHVPARVGDDLLRFYGRITGKMWLTRSNNTGPFHSS